MTTPRKIFAIDQEGARYGRRQAYASRRDTHVLVQGQCIFGAVFAGCLERLSQIKRGCFRRMTTQGGAPCFFFFKGAAVLKSARIPLLQWFAAVSRRFNRVACRGESKGRPPGENFRYDREDGFPHWWKTRAAPSPKATYRHSCW